MVITTNKKPLAVNPLKNSQPLGAAIAFLGIDKAVPMLHGCQGCTAFAKSLLERHFREPVYLKTTAITEVEAIMGGGESITKGINKVLDQTHPDLIGLITTGLTGVKGDEFHGVLANFRQISSAFKDMLIVPVSAPDYAGCLQEGYALAVSSLVAELVSRTPDRDHKQITLLPGSFLKPADIWELKETALAFGLKTLVLPDISGSLDGHLAEEQVFIAQGGIKLTDIPKTARSAAVLSFGESMRNAGLLMREKTGISHRHFDSLFGLFGYDLYLSVLSEISAQPIPDKYRRERKQLQDAMLDCHFYISKRKFALALEPDLLWNFHKLLSEIGGDISLMLSPLETDLLKSSSELKVLIGDLDDLESMEKTGAELVISNSNAVYAAERLNIPLMRAGFPITDRLGVNQRTSVGYRGSMNTLFEISNYFLSNHHARSRNDENSLCH